MATTPWLASFSTAAMAFAGAAVGHGKLDHLLAFALALRERDTDRTRFGELDRVVAEVEQDLRQCALVGLEHDGRVG